MAAANENNEFAPNFFDPLYLMKLEKREVHDFRFGVNNRNKPNHLIIVPEKNYPGLVRDYLKNGKNWYCRKCFSITKKKLFGVLNDKIFYAPLIHFCDAIPVEESNEYQESIKNKISPRWAKAHGLPEYDSASDSEEEFRNARENINDVVRNALASFTSPNPISLASFGTSINSTLANSRKRKPNDNDLPCPSSPPRRMNRSVRFMEPNADSNINNETNNQNDIDFYEPFEREKINIEVPQQPLAILTTPANFYHPSGMFLSNTCKKLCLDYSRSLTSAFLLKITFETILPSSRPNEIHPVSSPIFPDYACLSYFFTGEENHFLQIKNALHKHLFKNFKTLGKCLDHDFSRTNHETPIVSETLTSDNLTELHLEMLSQWLTCRITVFNDGIWKLYGNWINADDNVPIIILESKNDTFFPVLSLKI